MLNTQFRICFEHSCEVKHNELLISIDKMTQLYPIHLCLILSIVELDSVPKIFSFHLYPLWPLTNFLSIVRKCVSGVKCVNVKMRIVPVQCDPVLSVGVMATRESRHPIDPIPRVEVQSVTLHSQSPFSPSILLLADLELSVGSLVCQSSDDDDDVCRNAFIWSYRSFVSLHPSQSRTQVELCSASMT